MSNWLAALGNMALEGGRRIGANREENRLDADREMQRKQQLMQMALMQKDALRQERQFASGQAKDLLEMAGPNAMLDPTAAQTVRDGGFGFRLQDQEAQLPSKQFSVGVLPESGAPGPMGVEGMTQVEVPGQEAGVSVIPTAREQAELAERADVTAERERQKRYRSVVESPAFLSQPQQKRQVLWTAAGYPGQVPETFEEQRSLIDYQHKQEMEKIRTMYPADRFSGGSSTRGRNSDEQLYYGNVDRITDNVRAEYSTMIMAAANGGNFEQAERLQQQMRRDIANAVSQLPKPASLQAAAPGPRLADPIDDYLAGLTEDKLQTLVRNIGNPRFRQEFEAEEGVAAAEVFARLRERGFFNAPAAPAAPPPAPQGIAPSPAPMNPNYKLPSPGTPLGNRGGGGARW